MKKVIFIVQYAGVQNAGSEFEKSVYGLKESTDGYKMPLESEELCDVSMHISNDLECYIEKLEEGEKLVIEVKKYVPSEL